MSAFGLWALTALSPAFGPLGNRPWAPTPDLWILTRLEGVVGAPRPLDQRRVWKAGAPSWEP